MISDAALASRFRALLAEAGGVMAAPLTYSVEYARAKNPGLRALYGRVAAEDEQHLDALSDIIGGLSGASPQTPACVGHDEHVMDDVWRGARHTFAHRAPTPAAPEGEYARLLRARDTERRAADMYRHMMNHARGGVRERLDALYRGELRHEAAFARALEGVKSAPETRVNADMRTVQPQTGVTRMERAAPVRALARASVSASICRWRGVAGT